MRESAFDWTCPSCGHDQREWVTGLGPFNAILCESCNEEFTGSDLPREIDKAWVAAIEEVEND